MLPFNNSTVVAVLPQADAVLLVMILYSNVLIKSDFFRVTHVIIENASLRECSTLSTENIGSKSISSTNDGINYEQCVSIS